MIEIIRFDTPGEKFVAIRNGDAVTYYPLNTKFSVDIEGERKSIVPVVENTVE